VTPTGCAIATALGSEFGSPPPMSIKQIGQGAGNLDLSIPNVLQLWLGVATEIQENTQVNNYPKMETISVLETQIDDLNPQAIGYLFETLFSAGAALDVFTQPIGMKKSRPGILLTVICHPENIQQCQTIIFRETTTLGIRHSTQQRTVLEREMHTVETKYGVVSVKVAWIETSGDKIIMNVQPEYEDCAALARQHDIPWREVQRLAQNIWHLENSQSSIN
jgi:pyridinium-3,5-bisthiocarboxylic acid mononucleotide nickel chelatase